jgi:hypothetical protein
MASSISSLPSALNSPPRPLRSVDHDTLENLMLRRVPA